MSFTFVKIRKEASFQKDVLEEMFEDASEEVQSKIAELPELEDDNCPELLDGVYEVIDLLADSPKLKEQMFCLVSYLLNTQNTNSDCLNKFLKWFMDRPESPIYKVKICSLLFKSVNNIDFKKQLLIRSIGVLAREKKLVYLASFLQDIDHLLIGLKLSNTELSEVYLHIIRSLQEYPVYKKLVVDFVVKYLQIAEVTDTVNIDKFLSYLIDNSTVDERLVSVGQSPALKEYNSVMFRLFKLYLSGDIAGFHKLVQTEQAAIEKLEINTKDYLYKLKVQFIPKLASESKVISYKEFATRLEIPLEDVERLIIYAIQNDVVAASLDEFNQTITIKQVKSQYFNQSEWPSILTGLDALIGRLEDSLKGGVLA